MAVLFVAAAPGPVAAQEIQQAQSKLEATWGQQLEQLAHDAESRGLAAEAAQARRWKLPDDPQRLVLVRVPRQHDLDVDADGPLDEQQQRWRDAWRAARDRQADALFALARRAIGLGQTSLAYRLVLNTLRENPDHEAARKLLGQRRSGRRWATPYEVRKAAAKQVWDDRFGWLPADRLARYEQGERFHRGRWISAAEDARLHADILHSWQVETEHYLVITNHQLESGARLAARLERLYDVWQQTFASYTVTQEQLARGLEGQGSARRGATPSLRVVYFRDREEYVTALRPAQPNIEITIGIYFGSTKTAYFFADEEQDDATLDHEATHQLFSETRATSDEPGLRDNFWIIEGIALYMESLVEHDGYATLGGPDNVRLQAARQRLLGDGFYVPLAELTRFGRDQLQHDERIAMIYSQASGLAHFLMHAEAGRYREALVRYLLAVYGGQAGPETLAELTGQSYAELDQQYRAFLQALPDVTLKSPADVPADR
ncbi:MAG: DUF1570 domain-containing protein [Pirellulales bacterium]|nr:DUF1570 domain-containing protein [Pirellulales bacterium]